MSDFVARGAGYAVHLSNGDATMVLGSASTGADTIRTRLVGRRPQPRVSGRTELAGRSHYFIGNDPRHWEANVRSYARVEYDDVYPGVDLVYYGNQRQLEYDFIVAPGASHANIALAIDGARGFEIDTTGNLLITTAAGELTHRAPVLYQEINGGRVQVDGGYTLRPDQTIGFHVGEYDPRLPLVIDPVLTYSTYLGGDAQERIHGVAADAQGNIVVVGETYSQDFPTVNALQSQRIGNGDAFVAKLTATGDALIYATYFGGSAAESAAAVDVDASGAAYLVGETSSWDFPTLNPVQSSRKGQNDSFVVKLDAEGALVYSTLLGGTAEEYGLGIAVDADGRAHVAGSTWSGDFPAVGALQSALGGYPIFRTADSGDAWVGQRSGLRTRGITAFAIETTSPDTMYAGTISEGVFKSLDGGATWARTGLDLEWIEVYSLAIGGGSPAAVFAATNYGVLRSRDGGATWTILESAGWVSTIAVIPGEPNTIYAGSQYSMGVSKSTDDGDTWSQAGLTGGIISLAAAGSTIYAATMESVFVNSGAGWIETSLGYGPQITAVAVAASNPSIAYAGTTEGLFRTTTGGTAWEPVPMLTGLSIAKVAIAPSDPSTAFATVQWGGAVVSVDLGETWRLTHSESVNGLALAIHPQIPAVAYMGTILNSDGFIATLSPSGSSLDYATYFGGSNHEEITDLALDMNGSRYVTGTTSSLDLQAQSAVQPALGGLWDAFAAKIDGQGVLAYSTYLGGSGSETTPRLAVDAAGQAHIAGVTWSTNFPVASAHQPQAGGGYADVFLSVLTPAGDGFAYSTYLGGNGMETDAGRGPDVTISAAGDTHLTGTTLSTNFPATADAFQRQHAGGQADAFVTSFDASGVLRYSTYLGGAGLDYGRSIVVDSTGAIVVAGYTSSGNFPVRDALQTGNAGTDDGFITRLSQGSLPVDTEPPVTTVTLSGTPGQAGWYRSAVTVTLTANDGQAGSGVATIKYRLNNGPLQTYPGPFTIPVQGMTQLTAMATDVAGNAEVPGPSTTVMIDSVAPSVSITSPQAREYLYSDQVPLFVSSSDSTSGLNGPAAIAIDGVPFTGSAVDMSALALGAHTLTASVSDQAGNTSQPATVVFQVVTELDMVINVPAEAATIQAAIDRAINGQTVLVAPGTYNETLDFRGKAITVMSEQGAAQTIIDARSAGSVVSFRSGETRAAVLRGFTIRGGLSTHSGGGVYIASSSPTIRDNVITGNRSCTGVGIYSYFSSPLIQNNKVTANTIQGCTGGWGIGIYVGGSSSAEIVDNEITDNTGGAASGGGVALFAAGNALVKGNVIARNVTNGVGGCGWGGGLISANFAQARIIDNLIVGNVACSGGGVSWGGSTGINVFVNNTIADNVATASWPGMYVSGFDSRNELHNNIITASSGPAFYCQNAASLTSPVLKSNDIFSALGPSYGGTCADRTGLDGNVSADPKFLDAAAGDYRVFQSSPAVDAGNDAAPHLPATDVAGHPRVADGDADGAAHVDIGALEYVNLAPVVEAGADRVVPAGANCTAALTLTATGSDPDGGQVSFTWTGSFGTVSGPSLPLTLPVGTHVVTLTAKDADGGQASDTVVVTVVDATPPQIGAISASPSEIPRTNHDMVPVVVSVSAGDGCGGAVACRIVSVTSNEPVQGTGGGDKAPDWEITGDLTLNLRAERSPRGSGRIYTISVECTDASGNTATSTVTVTIPR